MPSPRCSLLANARVQLRSGPLGAKDATPSAGPLRRLQRVVRPQARRTRTSPSADCRRERGRGSLTGRWLPQFDLVSLRIDDPGKLAVLRVIDLVEDVAAFRFERRDHSVKIFNAVVDHERGFAWSKLIAFLRTNGPDGRSACGLAIRVGPGKLGTAPCLDIDGEMTLVPGPQRRCVLCREED